MRHMEIKDDIVRLLEEIVQRAHRINQQHPEKDLLLDIDLVKDDLRSLYRRFDRLAGIYSQQTGAFHGVAADGPAEGENVPGTQVPGTSRQQTDHQQHPPKRDEAVDRGEESAEAVPGEGAAQADPREETVDPAAQEETAAPVPQEETAAPGPREETAAPSPREETAAAHKKEEAATASTQDEAGSGGTQGEPKVSVPSQPAGAEPTVNAPTEPAEAEPTVSAPSQPAEAEPASTEQEKERAGQAGGQLVIPVPDTSVQGEKTQKEPEGQPAPEKRDPKKNNNNKAVIDILSQYSQPTIGDQFMKEEDDSLHQRIAGHKEDRSIGARMQQHPVSNLREVIGVNEKFLFINELFDGNIQNYHAAIATLNDMGDIHLAFEHLNRLAVEYGWDANRSAATIEKLANYVQRRHMKK